MLNQRATQIEVGVTCRDCSMSLRTLPFSDLKSTSVVMQKMHRWDAADVDRYASFVKAQRAQRVAAGGAYRLDLGEWAHLVEASDDGRLLEQLSPLLAQ